MARLCWLLLPLVTASFCLCVYLFTNEPSPARLSFGVNGSPNPSLLGGLSPDEQGILSVDRAVYVPPGEPTGSEDLSRERKCFPERSVSLPDRFSTEEAIELFREWAAADPLFAPTLNLPNGPWRLIPRSATTDQIESFKALLRPILERWREDRQRFTSLEPVESDELIRAFKLMLDSSRDALNSVWRG